MRTVPLPRLVCILWLFISTESWGTTADTFSAESESWIIGTLNVRNYLEQNRWHAGAYRFEHPKPAAEKAALRGIIKKGRPDILFLQEIGTSEHLEELRLDLKEEGVSYAFGHFVKSEEARTGLAILSTIKPIQSVLLEPIDAARKRSFQRGIQEVVFDLKTCRLRVLHVHLKSRYTIDETDPQALKMRTNEIGALLALAQQSARANPDDLILLAGDFNTPFEDAVMTSLLSKWVPVQVLDELGQSWTYVYKREGTQDRIDGFLAEANTAFSSWIKGGGLYPTKESSRGSDHRLVVIEVRTK